MSAQTLRPGEGTASLGVAAVVITCRYRPDLSGRYDRQGSGAQHYYYKKPNRDEGVGKYLLPTPGGSGTNGFKIGTKLSASSGGLARCTAQNIYDAINAQWMVKTYQGALRIDRAFRLELLEQDQAVSLTVQVRKVKAEVLETDLVTLAVRGMFQELCPDANGNVVLLDAVASEALKGERRLLELLYTMAAQSTTIDYDEFECAYLQSKDRYEIRVAQLAKAFGECSSGSGNAAGIPVEDIYHFAAQVFPHHEHLAQINWRQFKHGFVELDDFMEKVAPTSDWLVYRFSKIVGLSGLKDDIRRFHRSVLIDERRKAANPAFHSQHRLHMIFRGNPGTGKTCIAELMGRLLCKAGMIDKEGVLQVQRDQLVGNHIGETAIKTQFVINQAREQYGILFVDEAYRLHNTDGGKDFGKEAIEQLMASMLQPCGPTMIFAGYRKEMDAFLTSNPGLRSRINYTFDFEDYDAHELAQIFRLVAQSRCFTIEPEDEVVASIIQRHTPPGAAEQMNGRMCEIIFDFAKHALDAQLDLDCEISFEITAPHIEYACKRVPRPPQTLIRDGFDENEAIEDAEEWLLTQLDHIVGMAAVKEEILNLFYTARVDDLRRQLQMGAKSEFSSHMAFTGPPGVGKTTVARLIASLLHRMGLLPSRKCVEVQREHLVGGPDAVARVLEQAHGGVLFVDEAYRLTAAKDDRRGRETLEQLMASMLSPPPAPLMVFAGYEKEMNDFIATNPGIESRISYRFNLVSYSPQELGSILLLYIGSQGFTLKLQDEIVSSPEDSDAVAMLGNLISEHTSKGTLEVYNGRLCQHVFWSAKRRLDRRTSFAIRESGLCAANPRDIERHGLITNTLLLEDVVDGLRHLEDKVRGHSSARSEAEGIARLPPRVPIRTIFVNTASLSPSS